MSNIRPFAGIRPEIAPTAWVDESAIVIGDVHIGAGSSVWPQSVVRGDIQRIRVGKRSNIQDGCVLHVSHDSRFAPGGYSLSVGNHVTVGHKVILHGCEIGDGCLIGMGAIIMDGAVLEPNVMLGAGSLVTGGSRLEGGYLWVGSPARPARPLKERELEYLAYSAEHYVKLSKRHAESGT